jgi:hypothetical protein
MYCNRTATRPERRRTGENGAGIEVVETCVGKLNSGQTGTGWHARTRTWNPHSVGSNLTAPTGRCFVGEPKTGRRTILLLATYPVKRLLAGRSGRAFHPAVFRVDGRGNFGKCCASGPAI